MKAPAFQFYPADWLKDPAVQASTSATRGAWINLLCRMWESEDRGKLEGSSDQIRKLAGCDPAEWQHVVEELMSLKIADVTLADKKMTVINRRMAREHKGRINGTLRQRKYSDKRKNDAEMTVPSSSSSSSSLKKDNYNGAPDGAKAEPSNPPEMSVLVLHAFKKFVELYPKRDGVFEGSAECEAWFGDHQNGTVNWGDLVMAAKRYRDSEKAKGGYVMRPRKWLNEWRDWIPKAPPPAAAVRWAPTGFKFGPCPCGGTFAELHSGADTKTECDKCLKPYKPNAEDVEKSRAAVRAFAGGVA